MTSNFVIVEFINVRRLNYRVRFGGKPRSTRGNQLKPNQSFEDEIEEDLAKGNANSGELVKGQDHNMVLAILGC